MPVALRLRGELELPVLRAALTESPRRVALPVEPVPDAPAAWRRARELAAEPVHRVRATLLRIDADDHLLVMVADRAIADPQRLLDDLGARYRAALGAPPIERTPTPILAHEPPPARHAPLATLPPDHLPANTSRPTTGTVEFAPPQEVTNAVRHLASSHGTDISVVLLAAARAVLARYTGRNAADLAITVPGRSAPLLLRLDTTDDPSFAELVECTATALRTATAAPTHLPTVFDLPADPAPFAPGVQATPHRLPDPAGADLRISVADGNTLGWRLDYRVDRYRTDTVAGFARALGHALGDLAGHPDRPTTSAALLDRVAQHRLATTWLHHTVGSAPVRCVLDSIGEQVDRGPQRVALRWGSRQWTYRQVDELANQYAHVITKRTGGLGVPVVVAVGRSPALLPVLLGVLKSGRVYVPVDPAVSADELDRVLTDTGARLLVRNPVTTEAIDARRWPGALVTTDPAIAAAPTTPPPHSPGLADVAYVVYPPGYEAGVVVRHRSLGNVLSAMAGLGLVTGADRSLAVAEDTGVTADRSLTDLLLPLTVGAQVLLAGRATTGDGPALRALIDSAGVTVLPATAVTLRRLLATGWSGDPVRRVLCRAPVPARLTCGATDVWSLYGPAEATVCALAHRIEPGERSPIGTPLANVTALVLDDAMRPVPPGVRGELYLGGAALADGYLRRDDLTARRFVTGPDHARLFRTGEVCGYDAAGVVRWPETSTADSRSEAVT